MNSNLQNHITFTDIDWKSNHSENLMQEHDLQCGQGNTEDDKKFNATRVGNVDDNQTNSVVRKQTKQMLKFL